MKNGVREDRPVRVAFVIGQLVGGGAEHQLALLVERLDRSEFAPRVYTFTRGGPWAAYLIERGCHVELVPRKGHHDPMRLVRLYRRFRQWRPHVVFSVMSDAHLYATPAAVAVGVHGIGTSSGTVGARWDRSRAWLERRLVPFVDVRVGNAEAVSRDMVTRLDDDPRRQWTIYNGVDLSAFHHPDRRAARRLLQATDDAFLVGFIASFSEEKHHDIAVRALARIVEACPRVRLVMLGEGKTLEATRHLAAASGVIDRCDFLGFRNDVAALIPAFDVTINCSWREGCSNAILESLASGVPVVATSVGGNPEIVLDEVHGILFPSGDDEALAAHLARLYRGGWDRAAWGRAGRDFVTERFAMEKYVSEMSRLLRGLAALRRRPPFGRRGFRLEQRPYPYPISAQERAPAASPR